MTKTTDLVAPEATTLESGTALASLREHALATPPAEMKAALAEYDERRKTFRKWLHDKLVAGVHYGFPPGTEPKRNANGEVVAWDKNAGGKGKGGFKVVPPEQWQAKPSLYEAGADFLLDLLNVKCLSWADEILWKQLGERRGLVAFRSILVPRGSKSATLDEALADSIGEGYGAAQSSEGDMGSNVAVKKARKRAKVSAVRDTFGLADLFSVDIEDGDGNAELKPNPDQDDTKPKQAPRAERVTAEIVQALIVEWKLKSGGKAPEWTTYVRRVTGQPKMTVTLLTSWSMTDVESVRHALENFDKADLKLDPKTQEAVDQANRDLAQPAKQTDIPF